ncbi:kynureninase [Fulvivirgaceae bacterium BMA10]|uniref:Kynureninase n=1 Tax=Splendidivirga corallicola TaxID=3051826 RepID=A0ABT8KLC0_9BACT|nr:kynureninase [Fulvivirgaceae bacterium BMA10]
MNFKRSKNFAEALDLEDPLKSFRKKFHIPKANGKDAIYLCGNSLGLQPKSTKDYLDAELKVWADMGVEGHFKSPNPWFSYHKRSKKILSELVGGSVDEVVAMNSLTTNLHLLMVSFYRPNGEKFKIITEQGAFPSDQYALESQVRFHGFDPSEAIIELVPRAGEHFLRTEDILKTIEKNAHDLALVMLGGVQYYTGQLFDIEGITKKTHEVAAVAGFDLAHAIGNIPLELHAWQVDFAMWCGYKYLNSGPGGSSGIFVHEHHAKNFGLPRFAGWWGHSEKERFLMKKGFIPVKGADGWQLSNANVLSLAAHQASLEIFHEASMESLRKKSILLTNYTEFLINDLGIPNDILEIITPQNPEERGCQLSLLIKKKGIEVFEMLTKKGIIADWREPDVIRIAPVPLYNSFLDVYEFSESLETALDSLKLVKKGKISNY